MKKAILIIFLLVVVALGAGVYYVYTNLDSIVKAAIEEHGSNATKTAVRVKGVKINLTEGAATISGLTIANPGGFSYPQAFSLGEIGVDLNLEKISQDTIAIDNINIVAPEVFYEINADRQGNLNVIKDNLAPGSSGKSEAAESGSSQSNIKLNIRKFVFKDAALSAKIVPLKDKTYSMKLPPLVLNNLSGTPEQVSRQVMNQLIDHAKKEIKRKGLDAELAKLKAEAKQKIDAKKEELKQQADSKLDAEKEKAKDKLKGLLGN